MLVLSRKKNDTIIIDGNVTIEVLQVKGNGVRLGIKAPKHVRVLRGELKPFETVTTVPSGNRMATATDRVSLPLSA